ncbi:MAG TPA: hypothetical protein VFW25_01795 [Silvibacterium sp.]|nr:hypothetical protein [Silvibacterium sp.]
MARGWESKSVEDQVAEKDTGTVSIDEAARRTRLANAQHERDRQALELQRERILDERTSNPNRRAALAAALSHIEEKLKAFS